jgi:nucleoside-diphosphate-sugar epimerase
LVADGFNLPFLSNSCDEILLSHVLEHIPWTDTIEFLKEFHRVLKPTGMLKVQTHDFDLIVDLYTSGEIDAMESVNLGIWLNRKLFWMDEGSPGTEHKSVFTFEFLEECLIEAGFNRAQRLDIEEAYVKHGDTDMLVEAREQATLVTGSAGKIGSLVMKALGGAVGYDLKNGQNILDRQALLGAMQGCHTVVHCAGIPHPNSGTMDDYINVNVLGTNNVLWCAKQAGVKRVIYTSSTAYYGCNIDGKLYPELPITEETPPASIEGASSGALDSYNQSKVMAEQLLAYYGTNHLVETVALRLAPCNTKEDQYPDGYDWETDTSYRKGAFFANCTPEYAVQAIVLAVESEQEFWYEAFNICDRYPPDCVDVEAFVQQEYPDQEVPDQLISTEKAERVLGFEHNLESPSTV